MFARSLIRNDGMQGEAPAGVPTLCQYTPQTNTTVGAAALTAEQILSGWLQRSGPAGGFVDTWPAASSIIAAMEAAGSSPQVGDCFDFWYQNTVAQAMTFAAGTGIVSGTGTLNAAASVTRFYRHTILSNKVQAIGVVSTTNANAVLTNVPTAFLQNVMPGMGATGTGIGASAVVLGVAYNDTTGLGTITLSVNSTATADNIPVTFFPRIRLDSLGTLAA